MKKIKILFIVSLISLVAGTYTHAQNRKGSIEASPNEDVKIHGGMTNRISMNVTVPKQTQGATFGEKVNKGINVTLVDNSCIVLFPANDGYKVNLKEKSMVVLTKKEGATFGEKMNAGLHAAGSAVANGTALVGGALPGGAIISASVSSVGSLAGGSGAAAASYAATGRQNYKIEDSDINTVLDLPDGEYELVFVVEEKATAELKDTLKTQVRIGFIVDKGYIKSNRDTAKNSVSNMK